MNKKEIVWSWFWHTVGLLILGPFGAVPAALVFLAIFSAAVGLGITTWEWGSDDGNAIMAMIYAVGVGSLGGGLIVDYERKKKQNTAALENAPYLRGEINGLRAEVRNLEKILEDEIQGRLLLVDQLESDLFREGSPDLTRVIESSRFAPHGLRSETLDAVGRGRTELDEFGRMVPEGGAPSWESSEEESEE